jgi:hypothetical protein
MGRGGVEIVVAVEVGEHDPLGAARHRDRRAGDERSSAGVDELRERRGERVGDEGVAVSVAVEVSKGDPARDAAGRDLRQEREGASSVVAQHGRLARERREQHDDVGIEVPVEVGGVEAVNEPPPWFHRSARTVDVVAARSRSPSWSKSASTTPPGELVSGSVASGCISPCPPPRSTVSEGDPVHATTASGAPS